MTTPGSSHASAGCHCSFIGRVIAPFLNDTSWGCSSSAVGRNWLIARQALLLPIAVVVAAAVRVKCL